MESGRSVLLGFFFFQAEDGIRDVAVTGVQTCALPICARLVAYVAGPDADAGLAETLRQALAGRLPDYMQPSAIVVLPALALNANGKEIGRASCRERV